MAVAINLIGESPYGACPDCDRVLARSEFHQRGNGEPNTYCKVCANLRARVWHERYGLPRRLREHNLSRDAYEAFLKEQDERCAICRKPIADIRLCIDHDHETGRVRGLLCRSCNLAIGNAYDDPAILRAAAEYLERA